MIIEALRKGVGPWNRPYETIEGPHRNYCSGWLYRGINILLLELARWKKGFKYPLWLSYKEARKMGGYVRKGERGTSIVFFKKIEVPELDKEGNPVIDEETGKEKKKVIPLARFYVVFNVEQCEGIPLPTIEPREHKDPWEGNELLQKLYALPKIKQGFIPAYNIEKDHIEMPPKGAFKSPEDYWATFLHELTHWTGHQSRCDRQLMNRFGDQAYAMEEMVAEMGAAFLGAMAELPIRKLQHPEYIGSWIRVLENDSKAIFTASRLAQEACDWLLEQAGLAERALGELKKAA